MTREGRAGMTDEKRDVEALAEVLPDILARGAEAADDEERPEAVFRHVAEQILASDWLADRLAAARAEGAAAALGPVEALHNAHHWCQDASGVGDFFMVDGETGTPWPCPTQEAIEQGRDAAKGDAL